MSQIISALESLLGQFEQAHLAHMVTPSPSAQEAISKAKEVLAASKIPTIDLDEIAWQQILKAASESKWMPAEYCRNDWIADVCDFLENGHPA